MWFDLMLLALTAFGAATLLPMGSELLLLHYASEGMIAFSLLWVTASVFNTLGAIANWFLGLYVRRFQSRSWFPASPKQLFHAEKIFLRFGYWSLLLTWLPIVGDPLTVMAGVLRLPLIRFVPLVFLGKSIRYGLILWGSHWIL